jgi:hypothetical protein
MKILAFAFITLLSSHGLLNHGLPHSNITMCRCGCGK